MTTRLTFKPGNHSYWLADEDTGKKTRVPAVSTLLNQLAKPALVKWAAREAAEYAVDQWEELHALPISERLELIREAPGRSRDAKAASGTAIHAMAEQLLAGESVEVPESIAGHVQGFADWWNAAGLKTVASEAMCWSEHDPLFEATAYAGTLDILADHPIRGLGVVDIKTGSAPWPDQAVQLAAYSSAETLVVDDNDTVMPDIDWAGILRVHSDSVTLHLVDEEGMEAARETWELLRRMRTVPKATFQEQA